jgi:hypothetical protein
MVGIIDYADMNATAGLSGELQRFAMFKSGALARLITTNRLTPSITKPAYLFLLVDCSENALRARTNPAFNLKW